MSTISRSTPLRSTVPYRFLVARPVTTPQSATSRFATAQMPSSHVGPTAELYWLHSYISTCQLCISHANLTIKSCAIRVGKTTLMSAVIEKLLDDKRSNTNQHCIAYFYFKHKRLDKDTYNSLLRAILEQLIG